jgi:hypothetical protein
VKTLWIGRPRLSRFAAWCLLSAVLVTGATYAYLSDTVAHAPPTSGPFAYNTFKPGAAGFPALGGTYTDPVFGETIKRLSDIGANSTEDDLYAHCWGNANGTMYFHNGLGQLDIRRTSDGAVVAANQPGGNFDVIWHPTDPDKYLYRSGTSLIERSVSARSTSWSKDFGSNLTSLGGSINWVDRTGRYYVIAYGGAGHVYDRTEDVVYSNTISGSFGAGYLGITPDGKYAVFSDSNDLYSHALDHGANSISPAVMFMRGTAAASDHAVYVSASDGKNYAFSTLANLSAPAGMRYYAYDISINRAGMSTSQILASVLANGRATIEVTDTDELESHFSHGPNGAGQDWVFIDTEDQGDTFNSTPGSWRRYQQEIIAINVLTGAVRRLAHHRSRSVQNYYAQPRISTSWDASLVMWSSNFNTSSPSDYADFYGIQSPLGLGFPAPQNLRFK